MALWAIKIGFVTATLGKKQSLTGMAGNGRFGLAGRGCEKHGVLVCVDVRLVTMPNRGGGQGAHDYSKSGSRGLSDLLLVLYIYIRR